MSTPVLSPARPASTPVPTRTILLWVPDWPVIAAGRSETVLRAHPGAAAADARLALIDRGEVFACSAAARAQGVRRGQRVRDAQARCSDLIVLPYESQLDLRAFEPVLEVIEETMPGVQLLRPGTCAVRARGPAAYYGSEEEAALWLLDALDELGIRGARIGIADGPFTAEHAARASVRPQLAPGRVASGRVASGQVASGQVASGRISIVPAGQSASFLAPLPVGLIGAEVSPGAAAKRSTVTRTSGGSLSTLLLRLGIRTLGQFAALQATDVEARFGQEGARLHALAAGLDSRPIIARVPPEELDGSIFFEPPLDRVEQVAFGVRGTADAFVHELIRAQLVCTAIRVEIDSEGGELSERSWLHPRSFTAADIVDRVRWQLGTGAAGDDSGLRSAVTRVRIVPEAVDPIGNHEQGLWGTGHDERIHHGLSRVQSLLGHGGVLTGALGGGRTLMERRELVAWGDRPLETRSPRQPWPGQLPPPTPTTVFESPKPALVLDARNSTVDVDGRGELSGEPARFSVDGRTLLTVVGWAGPWPIDVRWWDAGSARSSSRFQVVDEHGGAWLLVLEDHLWWAEASYD
ncbi:DNA polymerase Y family protein [Lacisediminihabitans changchengi]|uniref:DNA polymerase Y family protein n=1 Tax=Lacisediminihabitans changchengi TaxID=2787634 RepID=A0A934SM97_9MICO|nr:DNA polymerase Y family protein [Lacisediminihabitans changchengi]MBK4346896.1 DNA polymerase Y family protein [Lacisediminihabitans changchengi]MBK4347981.1 DNA polymerase Y family protein [Lacisediminihabitans changchengi]